MNKEKILEKNIPFQKYQGTGNDFILFKEEDVEELDCSHLAKSVCIRNFGIFYRIFVLCAIFYLLTAKLLLLVLFLCKRAKPVCFGSAKFTFLLIHLQFSLFFFPIIF